MHIPDGVLSAPVVATGAALAAVLVAVALRRLDYERLPLAAVLASAFFVASLLTVPLGPSSVHLLLNGLMGLLLGWVVVPAVLVALILQAVFFGFGGVAVLGVNTLNLALPALLGYWLLQPRLLRATAAGVFRIGALAGALGVLGSGALVAATLVASGEAFRPAAGIILVTYAPLAIVEALVTGSILSFLQRVAPHLLGTAGTVPDA